MRPTWEEETEELLRSVPDLRRRRAAVRQDFFASWEAHPTDDPKEFLRRAHDWVGQRIAEDPEEPPDRRRQARLLHLVRRVDEMRQAGERGEAVEARLRLSRDDLELVYDALLGAVGEPERLRELDAARGRERDAKAVFRDKSLHPKSALNEIARIFGWLPSERKRSPTYDEKAVAQAYDALTLREGRTAGEAIAAVKEEFEFASEEACRRYLRRLRPRLEQVRERLKPLEEVPEVALYLERLPRLEDVPHDR